MAENLIATARHLDRAGHEQPEPFRVEADILWPDFKAVVIAQYDVPPDDVVIKYTDEDNDMITMTTQDELIEAMKTAADNGGIMQLEVKGVVSAEGTTGKKAGLTPVTQIDATRILPAIPRNKAPRTLPLITVNSSSDQHSVSEMAEPSDMRETGEITPNSDRDQETGLYLTKNIANVQEAQALETDSNSASSTDQPIESEKISSHNEYERMTGANLPRVPTDDSMPYPAFVEFMEKLKQELRNEIVHDVTKKTVKQVLRGLDHTSNRLEDVGPWGGRKTDLRHVHPIYLHEGISCKNCRKTILGPRYKCGNCVDYDLCEKCESKYGIHSSDHVFIKLRRPCPEALYRDSKKSPLLKRVLYKLDVVEPQESITDKKQEKMKKKVEKMFEKEKRKEEKLKRKLEKYEGLKDSPKKRERYELNHSPLLHHIKLCNKDYLTLGAAFVRDITIPDGTTVQPGTKMLKTWRLLNTGTCIWRETTRLRLMYGTIPTIRTEVSVPYLKPGEEGDVTAELLAPELPGRYQSHWKLFDKGIAFGHRVWLMINVVPREILEPKPVEPLRVVEVKDEEAKEIATTAEAPEEQRVERDVETVTTTTQSPMPLYRLIPSMLDQVDDTQEQEVEEANEEVVRNMLQIVDTQPSAINDLNKLNSNDSSTKIESLNVDVSETDDKVEMNLSSAVAAMEKLTVSEVRTTKVANVGNDLLSFEFLDRTPPKQSQTATPSNTPLDVSPPKSPVPTARLETVLSASSSMELVNGDIDECVPLLGEYPHERIRSLEFKQGTGYAVDDDIESLLSYSDSDSSSSDDFFVVPLPDCFDTSKPLTRSCLLQTGDFDENQNEVQPSQPSVDDLLQASTSDHARPLTPEVTAPEIPRDVPDVQAVTVNSLNTGRIVPSTAQIVPDIVPEIPRDVSILMPVTCDEIPQSEASCVETQTTIVQTSSGGAVGSESLEAQQMGRTFLLNYSSCYAAASGRPLTEHEHQTQVLEVANGGSQPAVECSQVNIQDGSATAGGSAEQQEFAKQLFDVAITTAANAASNAYFKVKEVIHTWQAKDLERQQQTQQQQQQQQQQIAQNIKVKKGWVPPKQEFKMPRNDWTPPEDTFQLPEDTYVPPQSTWTPPPDNYQPPTSQDARVEQPPMDQLMSMGFCNRELNTEVLKKSNDDVSKAIALILETNQEDWSSTRH